MLEKELINLLEILVKSNGAQIELNTEQVKFNEGISKLLKEHQKIIDNILKQLESKK